MAAGTTNLVLLLASERDFNSLSKMASEEASGSGTAPIVAAMNLDPKTLDTIIAGVFGKIQEAQRGSSGGGETAV